MKHFLSHLLLLLTFSILLASGASATNTPLSPFSKISVLTCSPGTDSYAIFGHSAIRVHDPVAGVDLVFNFGTFNADDPQFYQKFLSGRMTYSLSAGSFGDFLPEYQDGNRTVWEQVLNMSTQEKQLIWDRLLENLKEENRYYKYDFLYDNCSTRIRDALRRIYGGRWDIAAPIPPKSFRQQFSSGFVYNPWTGFGINICTGLPADKYPGANERLFLPQNLFDALARSRAKLVDTTMVYDFSHRAGAPAFNWTSPLAICWMLFAAYALVLAAELRYKVQLKAFDIFIFSVTGLAGLVMVFLWTMTDHHISRFNLNLLWASPVNLLIVFMPGLKRLYLPVLALPLVFSVVASHLYDPAVLPLTLILLTRMLTRSERAIAVHETKVRRGTAAETPILS
ncbi:MAG: DUF4105 domain-containing protein [Bacteroidetes bacterium]|nr:DUF4105 domain-containing protein [Bacteroidota bacterium]